MEADFLWYGDLALVNAKIPDDPLGAATIAAPQSKIPIRGDPHICSLCGRPIQKYSEVPHYAKYERKWHVHIQCARRVLEQLDIQFRWDDDE